MHQGQQVTYKDVNLWTHKGIIVAVGKTKHGGDCLVRWNGRQFDSEECFSNLRPIA